MFSFFKKNKEKEINEASKKELVIDEEIQEIDKEVILKEKEDLVEEKKGFFSRALEKTFGN